MHFQSGVLLGFLALTPVNSEPEMQSTEASHKEDKRVNCIMHLHGQEHSLLGPPSTPYSPTATCASPKWQVPEKRKSQGKEWPSSYLSRTETHHCPQPTSHRCPPLTPAMPGSSESPASSPASGISCQSLFTLLESCCLIRWQTLQVPRAERRERGSLWSSLR